MITIGPRDAAAIKFDEPPRASIAIQWVLHDVDNRGCPPGT